MARFFKKKILSVGLQEDYDDTWQIVAYTAAVMCTLPRGINGLNPHLKTLLYVCAVHAECR